jgi:hypothetical protein
MHWRNTKPPGCGGFFIGIVQTPSVIIDVIETQRIAFREAENHAPIGTNGYGPKASEVAFKRMEPEAGKIHICDCTGSIKSGENVRSFGACSAITPRGSSLLVKAFQSLVADSTESDLVVMRYVTQVERKQIPHRAWRPVRNDNDQGMLMKRTTCSSNLLRINLKHDHYHP